MRPLTPRTLRILNLAAGVVQALAGAAILGIYDYGITLPWYTFFISSWSPETDGFFVPFPKKVLDFPVGALSGAFLLLSAADHLLVALPGVFNAYEAGVRRNVNAYRWTEYAVSASIMRVLIAQLAGVTDIHLLFAIFFLTATTMAFGWLMERTNGSRIPCYAPAATSRDAPPPVAAPPAAADLGLGASEAGGAAAAAKPDAAARVDWAPLALGCVPHLAAWAVIFCYFFYGVSKFDAPAFVYAIVIVLFVLDAAFAVNQGLHFAQVRGWVGYAHGELGYIVLSLTSKLLLAFMCYGGISRFQDEGGAPAPAAAPAAPAPAPL